MTKKSWKNRIVGAGTANPAELVRNPHNYRLHGAAQRRAMSGALGELGWVQPVTVNRTTGRMVDGHMRVALAAAAGAQEIPVTYVELTEAEEKLALATIDPLGDMADRGAEALNELIGTLSVADASLLDFLEDLARDARKDIEGTPENRGKLNKEQGTRFERELGRELDGDVVGWMGGKEDVSLEGWQIQAKSGDAFPERLWRWLTEIPMRPDKGRALIVADEPEEGTPRRVLVVLELDRWRAAEGINPFRKD